MRAGSQWLTLVAAGPVLQIHFSNIMLRIFRRSTLLMLAISLTTACTSVQRQTVELKGVSLTDESLSKNYFCCGIVLIITNDGWTDENTTLKSVNHVLKPPVVLTFCIRKQKEKHRFRCGCAADCVLTGIMLISCVSVVLLHAAVLIQGYYEPGRQPGQFQVFGAVQLTGHQGILSSRALELQLQLGQKGLASGPRCLLRKVKNLKSYSPNKEMGAFTPKITNTDLKVWIFQPGIPKSQTEPEWLRLLVSCEGQK